MSLPLRTIREAHLMKITLVGAGSQQFGPATIRDILLSDAICGQELEVALMDISPDPLPSMQAYAKRVAVKLGRTPIVTCTTDINEAVSEADFVVTAIEIRRYHHWAQDFHLPRQYGFNQIYGENGGPGGLFHALRNMGPSLRIARAMERHCPQAWLLNYTNPLTKLCQLLSTQSRIRTVGLCHGVFAGKTQLSRLLQIPLDEIDARASGLNHITWFQSITHRKSGENLYPRLHAKERVADPLSEWDEIALSRILFRTFGLYPSPGTNHIGEYIGWAQEFLGSSLLQFYYDPMDGHPWETGKTPPWIYNLHEAALDRPLFGDGKPRGANTEEAIAPSGELAIPIIEGLRCGRPQRLDAVNVPNEGAVPGLPDDAIVEVPAKVDQDGLHPTPMPPLPECVQAILRLQVSINRLLVEAFCEESRAKLLQAVLLDPSTRSYRQAASLVNAMCTLQSDVLPPLR